MEVKHVSHAGIHEICYGKDIQNANSGQRIELGTKRQCQTGGKWQKNMMNTSSEEWLPVETIQTMKNQTSEFIFAHHHSAHRCFCWLGVIWMEVLEYCCISVMNYRFVCVKTASNKCMFSSALCTWLSVMPVAWHVEDTEFLSPHTVSHGLLIVA